MGTTFTAVCGVLSIVLFAFSALMAMVGEIGPALAYGGLFIVCFWLSQVEQP